MKAIYWILGIILACILGYYMFYVVVGFVKIIIGLAAFAVFGLGFASGYSIGKKLK